MFLRKIVLLLMALLVFAQPWGSGAFDIISVGPLGLMSILGILAFMFAVTYLLFGAPGLGRTAVPMDAAVTWLGVFVALNLASIGWADVPGRALSASINVIQLFVFVWLLLFLRLERRGFETILHAYVLGSILVALWSAYALFVVEPSEAGVAGRLDGFNRDANFLGYTLLLAVPMAYYLANQGGIGFLRWAYYAFVPLAIVLAVFTGSRGMAVALLAWLAIFFWFLVTSKPSDGSRNNRARVLVSSALVLGISLVLVLAVSDVAQWQIQRILTITDALEHDVGGRLHIWLAGLEVFFQNMMLGVGAGGFPAAIIPYFEGDAYIFSFIDSSAASHNTYLNIAVTTGILGLVIFGAVVLSLFRNAARAAPSEKLLFVSLLTISLTAGLSLHLDGNRLFYLALFAQVALSTHQLSPGRKAFQQEAGAGGESNTRQGSTYAS